MSGLSLTAIHLQNVAGRTIEQKAPPSEDEIRKCVLRVLAANVLCSIATVTPAGDPHINTAYFSYSDDLDLYFLSHPECRHCRNLRNNPSMAMTVFSPAQWWTEPGLGVQLFGTGKETVALSAQEAQRSYAARFQAYAEWRAALNDDDLAYQYRFYRFSATVLKILDEQHLGDAVWVVASVVRP